MKAILPILVLALSIGIAVGLYLLRPEPTSRQPEIVPTPVSAMVANEEPTVLSVRTQGTVVPFQEATVAAQVGGLILETSENLKAGRFVNSGDLLVAIDPTDFENTVSIRQSELEQVEASWRIEEGRQTLAKQDLELLGDSISDVSRALGEIGAAGVPPDRAALADWMVKHPQLFIASDGENDEELRELHFGVGSRATHRVIYVVDDDAVRVLAVRRGPRWRD